MSLTQEKIKKKITDLDIQILDLEKKSEYLQKIENQLADPQYIPFQEEVSELRKYLKDLNSIQSVKDLFRILDNKVVHFKTQSKKLREKLKDIPLTFIKSDLESIESLLLNPEKLEEVEEKISQMLKEIDARKRIGFPLELPQYMDISFIGSGGFSYVYGAKRINDGKNIALKIPKTSDKRIGKSFIRELNNWVGLKHQNIVEIFDYNILPIPYIEMEICDSSLDKTKTPLNVADATKIIYQISNGIQYAHKKKIVHLDLKPQNILLKKNTPKISDWGMSRLVTEQGMTTLGLSLPFAAPEQFSNTFGEKDEQTDIWQLGVLFYYLITGNYLFSGGDFVEYAEKITSENISKTLKQSEISLEVTPILKKCLEKDKINRYKSIEQFQRDLEKLTNNINRYKKKKSVKIRKNLVSMDIKKINM